MSTWTTVDEAYLLGAMPTALRAAYDAWLVANPGKAGRLAAVAAGVVADFREGLRVEAAEELDADAATLPERCARHALAFVYFHLGVEMGENTDPESGGLTVFSTEPPESSTATVFNVAIGVRGSDSDRIREYELAREYLNRLYAGPTRAKMVGSPRYGAAVPREARSVGDL